MAMLAMVPILAMFGVFEPKDERVFAAGASLELALRYPSAARHRSLEQIEAKITNGASVAIPSVTVTFDRNYVDGFSNLSFLPEPQSPYRVELANLRPNETRVITIEAEAEGIGRFRGLVTARAGREVVRVNANTFIFP